MNYETYNLLSNYCIVEIKHNITISAEEKFSGTLNIVIIDNCAPFLLRTFFFIYDSFKTIILPFV